MRGHELKEALNKLNLTQRDLCRIMGRDEATVSLWCTEKQAVPKYVESYITVALQVQGAKDAIAKPI